MKPKGTIYQLGKSGTHGELFLFLPVFVRLGYHFIRGLGAGLIAFAVLTFSFSFGPVLQKEFTYNLRDKGIIAKKIPIPEDYSVKVAEAQKVIEVQKEAQGYGVTSHFSVVIPKIDAQANIIANVDANDKKDYLEALSKGVAHVKGTYFPGQDGTIFLFSHSTDSPLNFARYNAVFYLLKKLEPKDKISIYFADKKYVYVVKEKVVTIASDVSWLKPKQEGEELILMTCDPPGTTFRRLLVIARPVSS